jgi:hypothetical protein
MDSRHNAWLPRDEGAHSRVQREQRAFDSLRPPAPSKFLCFVAGQTDDPPAQSGRIIEEVMKNHPENFGTNVIELQVQRCQEIRSKVKINSFDPE